MLVSSITPNSTLVRFPPHYFPTHLDLGIYAQAVAAIPYLRYFLNTMLITSANVIGLTLSSILVAYSFARIRWRGRDLAFSVLLLTLFLPGIAELVPQYVLFHDLGWVGTFLPLTVPAAFGSAFNIFVLRQFFRRLPVELFEAARVDGASHWWMLWRLTVPLSKAPIAAMAILNFIDGWEMFQKPLIYLTNQNNFTLAIGLYAYQNSHTAEYNEIMAASVLYLIPMALVFVLGQRALVTGSMTSAGLKG
jgi:ABC-type glycerol-3-phosphate transport system permease component